MYKKLFHEEVYLPSNAHDRVRHIQKNIKSVIFSRHFLDQHTQRHDYKHHLDKNEVKRIVLELSKSPVMPFEIEYGKSFKKLGPGWKIIKFVVRVPYNVKKDITIVIAFNIDEQENKLNKSEAFIKTAWLNDVTDTHKTLDRTKYDLSL